MRKMLSLAQVVTATQGEVINRNCPPDGTVFFGGVSTDSRTAGEGDLFVALTGEKFDGHDFCGKAFENGVRVFVVSDASKIPDGGIGILVGDTRVAYGRIARHYRMSLKAKVIAVTGSVGKTSTREMITKALASVGKVHSTKANFNNEVGMPATILSAPEDTDYLVVEMGMRGRGEISYLTDIACPDIAVITNVGFSHIERLGSREQIRLAKMEITEGLTEGGILLINGDDDFLRDYALANTPMGHPVAVVSCEGKKGDYLNLFAENITDSDTGIKFDARFDIDGRETVIEDIALGVSGIHNVRNALMALMCVKLSNKDPKDAVKALSDFEEMKGRGKVFETERYIIIDDAYNAAPESMEAAFARLGRFDAGRRKIAVLGGMLELGDSSKELHERIGRSCGKYSFDKILVTGEYSSDFIRGLLESDPGSDYEVFDDTDSLDKALGSVIRKGDVILFKASNAFGFGKLADRLKEETV